MSKESADVLLPPGLGGCRLFSAEAKAGPAYVEVPKFAEFVLVNAFAGLQKLSAANAKQG